MPEPVLCPVMPELIEALQQPGGWVTTAPVRVWLAPDNVLCVEELKAERPVVVVQNFPPTVEIDERPFRDLANAVADYLEGRTDRAALGQALVAAANALGGHVIPKQRYDDMVELERFLYPHGIEEADCNITPPETAPEVLRYDGSPDARA